MCPDGRTRTNFPQRALLIGAVLGRGRARGGPRNGHASTLQQAKDAVARGYTAIETGGVANPVAKARAIRDAVGPDVDVMIDLHGPPWLPLRDAITIRRLRGELRPLWVEEPLAPENMDGYHALRRAVDVPLAAGERLGGLHGIAPLLLEGLINVAQPDTGHADALTGLKKIAALAEARFATIAPDSGSLRRSPSSRRSTCWWRSRTR